MLRWRDYFHRLVCAAAVTKYLYTVVVLCLDIEHRQRAVRVPVQARIGECYLLIV